jgi:threonyl-tRNA synthetase
MLESGIVTVTESEGDFIDLYRGPHSPSIGRIKHCELTKFAKSGPDA